MNSEIRNWHWPNLIGLFFHWIWVLVLCSWHDSYWKFYWAMSTYQGTLALLLLSNHMYRSFIPVEDMKYQSFARRMIEVNVNLKASRWTDWWYGGLHFHTEHHVFPKMPRYSLRCINYDIKKFCKDQGVRYEVDWVWNVFSELNRH